MTVMTSFKYVACKIAFADTNLHEAHWSSQLGGIEWIKRFYEC